MRLRDELTGDRLRALDYFYHTYFKEDSPEDLEMKELEYGSQDLLQTYQDQIKVKPIYKRLSGWLENTKGIKKWKDLPKNAKKYFNFIKNYCGFKMSSISTSPKREDTILLENPFK